MHKNQILFEKQRLISFFFCKFCHRVLFVVSLALIYSHKSLEGFLSSPRLGVPSQHLKVEVDTFYIIPLGK